MKLPLGSLTGAFAIAEGGPGPQIAWTGEGGSPLGRVACRLWTREVPTRYSLGDVTAVPFIPDPDFQRQMIGEAAGAMMDLLRQDGMSLGVGWVRRCTAARRLTARSLNGVG